MVKLFSSAVMDQVLLSGANFAVGFALIRFASDRDYGIYVLIQTTNTLLVGFQRWWFTGPLANVIARKSAEDRLQSVGAVRQVLRTSVLWGMLGLQLLLLGGYALGVMGLLRALLLAGVVLTCWAALRREFLRDVFLIYSRPHSLLSADIVYVVLLLVGAFTAASSKSLAMFWVVATLSGAALASAAYSNRMLTTSPGWVSGDAAPVLREIHPLAIWSTVGGLTYWLYTQSFNYLLADLGDLKTVADVNAARLTLMPAIMLTVGVGGLLTPMAAMWYAEMGLPRLLRRLAGFIWIIGFVDLCYLIVLWISRDWVIGTLLHKQITSRDELIILWWLVAAIGLVRDVLQCALFALGRFKDLARQGVFCAVVAVVLAWVGIPWWGGPAVLIAQIVGELINLAGIGLILRQAYGSARLQSTA
jgi:O-antigen/teichoic acid export membrane protein